jgi:GGDEF domain-containing protein
MARFSDTVFAFLLPDMPSEPAKALLDRLQMAIAESPVELERRGAKLKLHSSAGIAAYPQSNVGPETGSDDLLAWAERALRQAESSTNGAVQLFATNGKSEEKPADLVVSSEPRGR